MQFFHSTPFPNTFWSTLIEKQGFPGHRNQCKRKWAQTAAGSWPGPTATHKVRLQDGKRLRRLCKCMEVHPYSASDLPQFRNSSRGTLFEELAGYHHPSSEFSPSNLAAPFHVMRCAQSWQSRSLSFWKREEKNSAPFLRSQRMQLILWLPWYVDQTFCHSVLRCCCLGQLCQSFHSSRNHARLLGAEQSIMRRKRWLSPPSGNVLLGWLSEKYKDTPRSKGFCLPAFMGGN